MDETLKANAMEIGASLAQLEISASDPRRLASFYSRTFCLGLQAEGGRATRLADFIRAESVLYRKIAAQAKLQFE